MKLPDGLYAPPIAHRGLWRAGEAAENSLVAFETACQTGFGVELDVRLSADHEAMVFHDEGLERLTGAEGPMASRSSAELQALALPGGEDRIPTLAQALRLIAGRVFLLVEIKPVGEVHRLCNRAAALLDRYGGPFGVISFDASALAWFAAARPDWPRGLDAAGFGETALAQSPDLGRQFAELTALAQPHFLVLDSETAMGSLAQTARAHGQPVVAWTIRSTDEATRVGEHCDNFIFEGFTA